VVNNFVERGVGSQREIGNRIETKRADCGRKKRSKRGKRGGARSLTQGRLETFEWVFLGS